MCLPHLLDREACVADGSDSGWATAMMTTDHGFVERIGIEAIAAAELAGRVYVFSLGFGSLCWRPSRPLSHKNLGRIIWVCYGSRCA